MLKLNDIASRRTIMKILKEKIYKLRWNQIFLGAIGGFGIVAFAITPRKVTIPAHSANSSGSVSAGVELYNGSPVAVSYKVTCYKDTGAVAFGPTNQTLNAKQRKTHGATPSCSSGAYSYTGKFINGMIGCDLYAYAPNVASCPANHHLCSFAEVQANAGDDHNSVRGWIGSAMSFTVSADWSAGYSSTSSMFYNYVTYSSGGYGDLPAATADSYAHCFTGTNGSGTDQPYCSNYYYYNSRYNFCCPEAGAEGTAHSCDVEVVDPTSTGGYLQSPQFKGSSPF
jgi:hypothetical protein